MCFSLGSLALRGCSQLAGVDLSGVTDVRGAQREAIVIERSQHTVHEISL